MSVNVSINWGDTIVTPNGERLKLQERVKAKHRFVVHYDGWMSAVCLKVQDADAPFTCIGIAAYLTDQVAWPYGNVVFCTVKRMAQFLRIRNATAYRALAVLRRVDIIRRVGPGVLVIDPHLVWAGNEKLRESACERWDNHDNAVHTDNVGGNRRLSQFPRVLYGDKPGREGGSVRQDTGQESVSESLHQYY